MCAKEQREYAFIGRGLSAAVDVAASHVVFNNEVDGIPHADEKGELCVAHRARMLCADFNASEHRAATLTAERDALKQRVDDLLAEVATAKEVEREACAKVADEHSAWADSRAKVMTNARDYNQQTSAADEIAVAIRERH